MAVTLLLIRIQGLFRNPLKSLMKWIAQEAEKLADYVTGWRQRHRLGRGLITGSQMNAVGSLPVF
jgi:hypothetical protein